MQLKAAEKANKWASSCLCKTGPSQVFPSARDLILKLELLHRIIRKDGRERKRGFTGNKSATPRACSHFGSITWRPCGVEN